MQQLPRLGTQGIWVREIKSAPERREVVLTFRVPEPMMIKMVARVLSGRIHNQLSHFRTRTIELPLRGRRNPPQKASNSRHDAVSPMNQIP